MIELSAADALRLAIDKHPTQTIVMVPPTPSHREYRACWHV
jgi:hypothetical protein